MPTALPPSPWKEAGGSTIGGLIGVGYAADTDDLLVVSSQGRAIFDCLTGERVARDRDESFKNWDKTWMTAPGIGKYDNRKISIAGSHGGGLILITQDGWVLETVALDWPKHSTFLLSDYGSLGHAPGSITKLCDDTPCEHRAAGFSSTGKSLVIATSGEVRFFARPGLKRR